MKIFTNRIIFFLFVIMATTVFGCEAGMDSGKNSNESTTGKFSFSDMYSKFSTMQERINALEQTVSTQTDTINSSDTIINQLQTTISAQETLINTLQTNIGSVQTDVDSLQTDVSSIQTNIGSLQADVTSQSNIFQGVSRLTDPHTGQPTIRFSGVNVQIVNGLGYTNGKNDNYYYQSDNKVNGLGNLIVGYNEKVTNFNWNNDRSGSHNIIVGTKINYSSHSGIVVGLFNSIGGQYCGVTGGRNRHSNSYGIYTSK